MRKWKIGTKMSLLFVLFALIMCLAISLFSYFASYSTYSDFYSRKARETAALAATFIDGDRIAAYLEMDAADEYYERLSKILGDIKREHNVKFLYVFVPEADRFTYILEASIETDDPSLIAERGDVYPYTELEYTYLVPDIAAKKASTEKVISYQSTEYGQGVSAWAPVFDTRGELVAMVEADLSLELVFEMLAGYMTVIIILSCTIILAMVVLLALFSRRIVTRPLARLTQNVLNFASGDALNTIEDIHTGDEIQTLNEAFKQMSEDIDTYTKHLASTAADRERIATELNVAIDIKKSLLPKPFEGEDAFSVNALMDSGREAGGDFYDFFFIDERRVCVVVANVSGKGIPTALFMVVAKTMIKNQMMAGAPVDQAMAVVNARLFESNPGNLQVAAFVGVLEKDTGYFSYVNAGARIPLMLRKGGSFEWFRDQVASVLAANKNVAYRRMELALRQGDKLFLYTSGIPALKNAVGEELGTDALRDLLNAGKLVHANAEELLEQFNGELRKFAHGAALDGDATMLALTYDKGDRALAELFVPPRADSFSRVLPFIRTQLAENGLDGAFYAGVAIALEELFVIAVSRVGRTASVLVRCSVSGGRVEIKLLYDGRQEDPLESATQAERDAIAFIRKNSGELSYSVQEERNVLTMVKERGRAEDGCPQKN